MVEVIRSSVVGLSFSLQIGYDLAVVLAVTGIVTDGDVVTQKLSIGGDATSQTAFLGGLLGDEGGLNTHNTYVTFSVSACPFSYCQSSFEVDASLSRNDYYLADGDNHSFNTTVS